jgi:short-subunit dehydrogenase
VINSEDAGLVKAADQLRRSGVEVQPIQADLRHEPAVERLSSQVSAGGRTPEVAALNAGVGEDGPFLTTDVVDEWRTARLWAVGHVLASSCPNSVHYEQLRASRTARAT